jgi:alpha-mannosidase
MHDPMVVESGKLFRWLDQGVHEIVWRLVPHNGNWQDAGTPALAETFANPPQLVYAHAHGGSLPSTGSLMTVEPRNIILGSLKVAEDGDDLIIRLYESEGKATEATVNIMGHTITTLLTPYELKTLKLDSSGNVKETDLLER